MSKDDGICVECGIDSKWNSKSVPHLYDKRLEDREKFLQSHYVGHFLAICFALIPPFLKRGNAAEGGGYQLQAGNWHPSGTARILRLPSVRLCALDFNKDHST